MSKSIITLIVTTFLTGAVGLADAADTMLKTDDDKTFYALGIALSRNLAPFALSDDELAAVIVGMKDGVSGAEPKVDLQEYGPKIQALAQARQTKMAEAEKAKAAAFLEEQAKKPGAKHTESGLIYIEVKPGTGASPAATDKVTVHYHGTLSDGTVFDSSVDRGEPATFGLNRVIKCWTEGVQMMKVGGKSQLICPSDIAYGDRGSPPKIAPGAALVFDVELIEIVK
jgi:FKBP-type peptidyl-prolyl cis-trans isomerase FkpA